MSTAPATAVPGASVIQGNVHGGQQPIIGAAIQLYAAGTPTAGGGYGLGSTPLITVGPLPLSDSNGNFTITGRYTLPTSPSLLYIVATGGSASLNGPVNSGIALMGVLQGCTPTSLLSPTEFVNINEVTTMASVLALQPFMAAPASGNTLVPAIGAPTTAYNAMQDAFATVNDLANVMTGTSLNHSQNYGTTDTNALLLNSLGDTLAYCVNSNPTSSGQCANLFTLATPTGFTAADTIQTAWYIAQNPSHNVGPLFNLASASPPFVGLATAPTNFTAPVTTSPSACQAAVPLGASSSYAVLAGSTVTNASTVSDQTTITGGLVGVSPGTSTTGFTAGTYVALFDNTDAASAQLALTAAYNNAAGLLSPAVLPVDVGGVTFGPGLYNTASAVTLNAGAVTLDAQGDPNAVFVFQIGSTFTAGVGTQVILINGANAKNVFWQVGSSATINANAAWAGNIIAYAAISLGTDATLNGRAMAQNGAVTLLSNKITVPQ